MVVVADFLLNGGGIVTRVHIFIPEDYCVKYQGPMTFQPQVTTSQYYLP